MHLNVRGWAGNARRCPFPPIKITSETSEERASHGCSRSTVQSGYVRTDPYAIRQPGAPPACRNRRDRVRETESEPAAEPQCNRGYSLQQPQLTEGSGQWRTNAIPAASCEIRQWQAKYQCTTSSSIWKKQ